MNVGTVVAPAISRVALLNRATDRETRTLAREGRQRLLRVLAGPASTAPFLAHPRIRPTRSIGRPADPRSER
jgi:hypothetical protein